MQRAKWVAIRELLGLGPPTEGSSGSVYTDEVREVTDHLNVPWAGSIQDSWLRLVEYLGGVPEPEDGGDISAKGSGTITDRGFDKVLTALNDLQDRGAPLTGDQSTLTEITDTLPEDPEQGRRRVLAMVTRRTGQPLFRRALLDAYEERCCITDESVPEVLEAAHIRPFGGGGSNETSNGLLLRADIHTLFDTGIVAVDPDHRLLVREGLGSVYEQLRGVEVRPPVAVADHPDQEALAEHRQLWGW